ncbi:MAG: class I SAM-dependent methyltransferase [Nitrososphaerales archaeon]
MKDDDKLQNMILRLRKQYKKRTDDHGLEIGMRYLITLKNSRNIELSNFLRKMGGYALKNEKVLDVGCGIGGFLAYLQDIGIDAYGIDVEKELISMAFTKKNILVGDAHHLPFRDETFDLIIAFDVIEHLQNQEMAIENMTSKLRRNGRLVILTNNRAFPFDSDTKLFFINYLPKSLADRYLRFRRKRPDVEYDVKTPTFFTFTRLCRKSREYKVQVKGVFTVFGYYVEKFNKLKKIAAVLENASYRWKVLRWMQWFAPNFV